MLNKGHNQPQSVTTGFFRALGLGLLLALCCVLLVGKADAQTTGGITLQADQTVYPLAEGASILKVEPNLRLTPQIVGGMYMRNARNIEKLSSHMVFSRGESYYLIFRVNNNTASARWTLDLRTMGLFPTPAFKNITLWDGSTGAPITRGALGDTQISFIQPANSSRLIVAHLSQVGNFKTVFNPVLVSDQSISSRSGMISLVHSLLLIFAALPIGITAGAAIQRKSLFLSALSVGFSFFMAIIFLQNSPELLTAVNFREIAPAIFAFWLTALSFAFLYQRIEDSTPFVFKFLSFLSLALSAGLIMTSIVEFLGIDALADSMPMIMVALILFILWLQALLSTLSLKKPGKSELISLSLLFFSFAIVGLTYNGILPAASFIFSSFTICALIGNMILAVGMSYQTAAETQGARRSRKLSSAELDMKRKIAEKREGFDQARLKAVLERERKMMKDLQAKDATQVEKMRVAMAEAEAANSAKSAFLATISHEIRTPMTGVMGMVQLLKQTELSEEQRDQVETIGESGKSMMSLLNDILDLEKMESGKMDLEVIDFDLHKLLQNIYALMNGHAENKGIILKLDVDAKVPRYVKGDPTRLRQVITNLTSNSIKFTSKGSVKIQVRPISESEDIDDPMNTSKARLYFAVEDTGIGIKREAQKNLFNPFVQADSDTTRKYGGTGLGLAICQKIVNLMGGSISLNSAPGQGSTFFFSVEMPYGSRVSEKDEAEEDYTKFAPPIVKAPAREERPAAEIIDEAYEAEESEELTQAEDKEDAPAPVAEEVTGPLDILVTDDNDINRKVMYGFMAPSGHTIREARNGEEAVEIISIGPVPDLVFMDIEMPGMNGLEATQKIREVLNLSPDALPIVALTGNTGDEDIAMCKAAGMNDFLAKPIDMDAVMEVLKKVGAGKFKKDTIGTPDIIVEEYTPSKPIPRIIDEDADPFETVPESAAEELISDGLDDISVLTDDTPLIPEVEEAVETDEAADETDDSTGDSEEDAPVLSTPAIEAEPTTEPEPKAPEMSPPLQESGPLKNVPAIGAMKFERPKMFTPKVGIDTAQAPEGNPFKPPAMEAFSFKKNEELEPAPEPEIASTLRLPDAPPLEDDLNKTADVVSDAKDSQTEKAPLFVPGVDFSQLDTLKASLSFDDVKEMVDSLIEKINELDSEILPALNDGQHETLRRKTHDLKGMAGNFGLKDVATLAGRLEKSAKDKIAPVMMQSDAASLKEACARAVKALQDYMQA
ncbi:MAG: ATP-binding protein [Pseudobdellovibrionaceae bacterium]